MTLLLLEKYEHKLHFFGGFGGIYSRLEFLCNPCRVALDYMNP